MALLSDAIEHYCSELVCYKKNRLRIHLYDQLEVYNLLLKL
jgi:hypothetical protein